MIISTIQNRMDHTSQRILGLMKMRLVATGGRGAFSISTSHSVQPQPVFRETRARQIFVANKDNMLMNNTLNDLNILRFNNRVLLVGIIVIYSCKWTMVFVMRLHSCFGVKD